MFTATPLSMPIPYLLCLDEAFKSLFIYLVILFQTIKNHISLWTLVPILRQISLQLKHVL